MALDRRRAKREGIVEIEMDDPDFDDTLKSAHNLQLELTRERYHHEQVMKEKDMGTLGKFFGDGRNTQTFIALLSVLLGLGIYVACLITAKANPDAVHFLSESGSKALAFAGTALGYIFGRATSSSKR
ncbi:hypothetical protein SAMN04487996_112124 [Dyadobacter soli]|uniref:Uncharacterized protein n=1 Tax=Dyadobacter soli TaxID=659014 RepID=A0A1G7NQI5_9BACT|nr:hypothetical protein [Dyadobacter soli]SDF76177.1 hypothetical protein SAMN04487996_112124 [Dyadobacter soli]